MNCTRCGPGGDPRISREGPKDPGADPRTPVFCKMRNGMALQNPSGK